MGNGLSTIEYIGFEEMQNAISSGKSIIINTLPNTDQDCLIVGTILASQEETQMNDLLGTNKKIQLIVYGKNCYDKGVLKKASQLKTLGFETVCIYGGGLFEWLLLQDVYGKTEFRTTTGTKNIDLLKYK
jgi:hypothetical protein